MDIKSLDDFDPIVINRPLTDEDKAVFSAAIKSYKAAKNSNKLVKKQKKTQAVAA